MALLWFSLILIFGLLESVDVLGVRAIALIMLATFAGGVATIVWTQPRGAWSPAALFFIVLAVFHIGLAPYWLWSWDPGFVRKSDYAWFAGETTERVMWLIVYGLAAYVLAVAVGGPGRGTGHAPGIGDTATAARFGRTGSVILTAGLLLWLFKVISAGGAPLLFGSYSTFLEKTSGSGLSSAYSLIGLGLGLTVIHPRLKSVRLPILGFMVFAAVAFFLGLRGEVLFPSVVAGGVLAARQEMPSGRTVIVVIVGVLALVNGAQNIRSVGLADYEVDPSQFNPLAGIAELGTTARVVAVTVEWHEQAGEPYAHGRTYVGAAARAYEGFVDPRSRPAAASDYRLFNSEIAARSGNIGGSIVGEAFHNFGLPGVLVVMMLVGLVFARLSRLDSPVGLAIFVCVAVPLFNHIRNSFVPVIPSVVLGLIVVSLAYAIPSARRHERQPRA